MVANNIPNSFNPSQGFGNGLRGKLSSSNLSYNPDFEKNMLSQQKAALEAQLEKINKRLEVLEQGQ